MNDAPIEGLRFLEIDDEASGILAYAVDGGKISATDVAPVWQRFENARAAGKKLRIYAEMVAMPSVAGGVIFDKFRHLGAILSATDRIAVVGDAGWMDIYAKIVDPITRFDVRHFTLQQKDGAIAWIRE